MRRGISNDKTNYFQITGSREIIENEITGWLVEPSNPVKLAEKIQEVLDLPQEKDKIGMNARRRVREKFCLNVMLEETMGVYEYLLNKRKS